MRPGPLSVVVTVAACAWSLSACGGEPAASGGDGPVEVRITQQDGEISADPDIVEADRGQQIEILVDSDVPDEFHVHSDPEHALDVKAADDQRFVLSIDNGGQYEMESHELGTTILKLQIS